jgi:hypothetical protein
MTTITTEMARLATDFNGVRDGHSLIARFDFSGTPQLPAPGEQVLLYDGEGNRCFGVVVEAVDDEFFRVAPVWDSWMDADDHQTPGRAVEPTDLVEALRESVRRLAKTDTAPVEDFTQVA